MRINVTSRRQIDTVRLSPATYGRLAALHRHRKARVRKKYTNALIIPRDHLKREEVHCLVKRIFWSAHENAVSFTPAAIRRIAGALKRTGVDARPWPHGWTGDRGVDC